MGEDRVPVYMARCKTLGVPSIWKRFKPGEGTTFHWGGNDNQCTTVGKLSFASTVGGRDISMQIDIVPGDMQLLVSKSDLGKMGIVYDIQKDDIFL